MILLFSSTESLEILKEIGDSAGKLCDRLALELDRLRANYWKYRQRQIQETMAKIP